MDSSKTLQNALGDDEDSPRDGGSSEGEIRPPAAIEELIEVLGEVPLPEPLPKSAWPPDEVRKRRKIKQRMVYLERKAKQKKKKKAMRYWQRIKRKRDQDWHRYWNEIIPDDWKYYRSVWQRKGKTVLVEKQDWLDFLSALGGRENVGEVWSYEGVVSFDTILVYSPEGRELYRGVEVPDWYGKKCPVQRKPKT